MEIASIDKDGNVVVKMTAVEAKEVRADLGEIWSSKISRSGDQLHSLLEWAIPQGRS